MKTEYDIASKNVNQLKIMDMIVERLEHLISRNIIIKDEMTEKLNKIFPSQEEEEEKKYNEEPYDYCRKIEILIEALERTTTGHEFNLMHLRKIV